MTNLYLTLLNVEKCQISHVVHAHMSFQIVFYIAFIQSPAVKMVIHLIS